MVSVPNVLPVVLDHKDRDKCLPEQVMTLQESGIQCDRGVDAPETKQPYGPQAKAVLLSLVEGRSLRVLVYGVDQYGRIVADIYCKNVFIQVCHHSLLYQYCFRKSILAAVCKKL
jgi:hypothetical protein